MAAVHLISSLKSRSANSLKVGHVQRSPACLTALDPLPHLLIGPQAKTAPLEPGKDLFR